MAYSVLAPKPLRGLQSSARSDYPSSNHFKIRLNRSNHVSISVSDLRRPRWPRSSLVLKAQQSTGDPQNHSHDNNSVPPAPLIPLAPPQPTPPPNLHLHSSVPTPATPSTPAPPPAPPSPINVTPTAPAPSHGISIDLANVPSWAGWAFAPLFFSAYPIYRRMKMAQENMEKTLGVMAEAVEKAAEETDRMAEELAATLPEGKVKEVALKVEKMAEAVDKEAEAAQELIEKVDELTDRIEEIIEPIVEGDLHVNDDPSSGPKHLKSKL